MNKYRAPRALLQVWPAPLVSSLAIAGGLLLLGLAWLSAPRDGWAALIWALPGLYVVAQPWRGLARGQGDELRVGLRRIDLRGLQKVAVYERKQWGYSHAVAVLVRPGHVEEISGAFMTTKGFTQLVQWLGLHPEVLKGFWSPRLIAAERPDLAPRRPR